MSNDLTNSVLLVIDMQRYFLEPGAKAFLNPPRHLLPNILKLIEAFRGAGCPIIFTRHAPRRDEPSGQMGRWWNDELPWDGDEESELIPEIEPLAGETVIRKTKYSAFEGTDLDRALKGQGVDTVVICGIMTNLCVETTARHAFMKDFQPIVVEDACATKSAEFHHASIMNLEYGFAYIEKTDRIIGILGKYNE